MNRVWPIILLISLGLNVGLGIGLWRHHRADHMPPPHELPRPGAPGVGPHGEGPPAEVAELLVQRRLERMTRELHLDSTQAESLHALHRERGDRIVASRRQQRDLRHALRQLLEDPQTDWNEVYAVIARQSQLQARLDSTIARIMFEERKILTPEQRTRYHEYVFPLGVGQGGRRDGRPHERPRRGQRP